MNKIQILERAWGYVQGVLAAQKILAEVIGKQRLNEMSERELELINELNWKISDLAVKALHDYENCT